MTRALLLMLVGCSDFELQDLSKSGYDEPDIKVEPYLLSFSGAEPVTDVVTIINEGGAPLVVEQPVVAGEDLDRFTILSTDFPVTLDPGASTEAVVLFSAVGDTSAARLEVPSNDPTMPVAPVQLRGTVEVPSLEISPAAHDFGDVGLDCDAAKTFTLTNVGTGTLRLDTASLEGAGFSLREPLAVEELAPDASTTLSVRFMPDADAHFSTLLIVDSNDPRGPQSAAIGGAGEEGLPCGELADCEDGYWADYYNLPGSHPDVEGGAASYAPGDLPWFHDWYDSDYFYARQLEPGLSFGRNWFPIPSELPGDPYHFAVHIVAKIEVEEDMVATFEMGSDDDGWAFIDGALEGDLAGLHALEITTFDVPLSAGVHDVELYMAERHTAESAFWFRWLSDGISVFACPEEGE